MSAMYVVMAEEDDYYPDVRSIGVFATEVEAQAQPREVMPWAEHAELHESTRWMVRAYIYSVHMVAASPTAAWAMAKG